MIIMKRMYRKTHWVTHESRPVTRSAQSLADKQAWEAGVARITAMSNRTAGVKK